MRLKRFQSQLIKAFDSESVMQFQVVRKFWDSLTPDPCKLCLVRLLLLLDSGLRELFMLQVQHLQSFPLHRTLLLVACLP